jgi:hypothetical protein
LDAATTKRLEAHEARDKAMLAADIRNRRPDLILIHADWLNWTDWALTDPGLSEALSSYRPVATVRDVAIWKPVNRTEPAVLAPPVDGRAP